MEWEPEPVYEKGSKSGGEPEQVKENAEGPVKGDGAERGTDYGRDQSRKNGRE